MTSILFRRQSLADLEEPTPEQIIYEVRLNDDDGAGSEWIEECKMGGYVGEAILAVLRTAPDWHVRQAGPYMWQAEKLA